MLLDKHVVYLPVKKPKPSFSIPLQRTYKKKYLRDRSYRLLLLVRLGLDVTVYRSCPGKPATEILRPMKDQRSLCWRERPPFEAELKHTISSWQSETPIPA